MSPKSQTELKKLKLVELKKLCTDAALPVSGSKQELIDRIIAHDSEKPIVTIQPDEEAALLDNESDGDDVSNGAIVVDVPEAVEVVASGDAKTGQKRPAADREEEEVPAKKDGNLVSPPKIQAEEKDNQPSVANITESEKLALRSQRFGNVEAVSGSQSPGTNRVLDEQKKIDRARRFGLPVAADAAKGTAKERLQARAARFGTTSTAEDQAKSESLLPVLSVEQDAERKRKRLEKFGPVTVDGSAGEDAEKKKAERAARFGLPVGGAVALSSSSSSNGVDPEVLRKRAERFGLVPPSGTPTASS